MQSEKENSEITPVVDRPNVYKGLFKDLDYDNINWRKSYRMVIERVIENRFKKEWQEILRFYGRNIIVQTLTQEMTYIDFDYIDDVCKFFKIRKEDMNCYAWNIGRKKRIQQKNSIK